MTRCAVCSQCGLWASVPDVVSEPRLIAGAVLPGRCVDRTACLQRRFAPPRTYTAAHRIVTASRKAQWGGER